MLNDAILMQLDQQGRVQNESVEWDHCNLLASLACSGLRSMHHGHVTQLVPACQRQLPLISIPSLSLSVWTNNHYVNFLLSISLCSHLERSRESHLSVVVSHLSCLVAQCRGHRNHSQRCGRAPWWPLTQWINGFLPSSMRMWRWRRACVKIRLSLTQQNQSYVV